MRNRPELSPLAASVVAVAEPGDGVSWHHEPSAWFQEQMATYNRMASEGQVGACLHLALGATPGLLRVGALDRLLCLACADVEEGRHHGPPGCDRCSEVIQGDVHGCVVAPMDGTSQLLVLVQLCSDCYRREAPEPDEIV